MPERQKTAAAKIEGYAARFSLVIQMMKWAANGGRYPQSVDSESVVAGIQLARWFEREAFRVYAILNEGKNSAEERNLIEAIHANGGSITANELRKRSRKIRTNKEADERLQRLVEKKLGVLVDRSTSEKGGRPTKVFTLFRKFPPEWKAEWRRLQREHRNSKKSD